MYVYFVHMFARVCLYFLLLLCSVSLALPLSTYRVGPTMPIVLKRRVLSSLSTITCTCMTVAGC